MILPAPLPANLTEGEALAMQYATHELAVHHCLVQAEAARLQGAAGPARAWLATARTVAERCRDARAAMIDVMQRDAGGR